MKKYCYTLLLFFLVPLATKAQNWAGGQEDEAIRLTYTVQYNAMHFQVLKQANWPDPFFHQGTQVTTGLNAISASSTPGFGLGLGISSPVTPHLELRFVPTFVLNNKKLVYRYQAAVGSNGFTMPDYEQRKTVQGAFVSLPVNIKLKSDRRKNFGVYLMGGVSYSVNLVSARLSREQDKTALEKLLRNKQAYLSGEAGVGFDLFFEDFRLSPEIKYASTFSSVLKQDQNAFSKPIDRLMARQLTFSLYIQ